MKPDDRPGPSPVVPCMEQHEMDKIDTETMAVQAQTTSDVATKGGRAGLVVSQTSVKAGGGGGRSFYDLGKK